MIRCTLFLRIRMLRRRRSSICCGRAIRPICLAMARRLATRGAARRFSDRYSPRYLFAGIDRASMRRRPILSTFGVVDVARAGDEPAAVPSNIVAATQERESAGDFDRLKSAAFASPGRNCAGDRGRLRRHDRHSLSFETGIALWCCSSGSDAPSALSYARSR